MYLFAEGKVGFLQTKSDTLVNDRWWRLGFYAHIICGGVALSIGWSQFVERWRSSYLPLHRAVGTLYVIMAGVSGVAAVCIAPQTSTGWIAGLGFGSLGMVWLYVTQEAYRSIRQRDLHRHEHMMVFSYSACVAAVTLRLWLPLLLGLFRLDFSVAYPIVAWLCWVPNLFVAHTINSRRMKKASEGIALR